VWVTRTDHTTVVPDSARVSGDSLVGIVNGERRRLPLSETTVPRAEELSLERTVTLVMGSTMLLAVAWME